MKRLERFVTQPPLGFVHDALKCQVIVRLGDEPQIGIGVAHFHTFVEAGSADDPIGET